jgi:hypothetical protein
MATGWPFVFTDLESEERKKNKKIRKRKCFPPRSERRRERGRERSERGERERKRRRERERRRERMYLMKVVE